MTAPANNETPAAGFADQAQPDPAFVDHLHHSETGYRFIEGAIEQDLAPVAAEMEAARTGPKSYRIIRPPLEVGQGENLPIVDASTFQTKDTISEDMPMFTQVLTSLEGLTGSRVYAVTLLFTAADSEIPDHQDPFSVAMPRAYALIGVKGTGTLRVNEDPALGFSDTHEQSYGPGDVVILDAVAVRTDGTAQAVDIDDQKAAVDPQVDMFTTRSHEATSGPEDRMVALVALVANEDAPGVQDMATIRASRLFPTVNAPAADDDALAFDLNDFK